MDTRTNRVERHGRLDQSARRWLVLALCACLAYGHQASAQTGTSYRVVTDFGTSEGYYTEGPVVRLDDGTILGSARYGGAKQRGTVFVVPPIGLARTLHDFTGKMASDDDGSGPRGGLIRGSDLAFYGTTWQGGKHGAGTIFRVTLDGEYTRLFSFGESSVTLPCRNTGSEPLGGLLETSPGVFHGTTQRGGEYGNGTIFRARVPQGATAAEVECLHSFGAGEGAWPGGTLAESVGSGGLTLVGTAPYGGENNCGTAFKFDVGLDEFSVLHTFHGGADGCHVSGVLTEDQPGVFYGVTQDEGIAQGEEGGGTIFRVTTAGQYAHLYTFPYPNPDEKRLFPDGAHPIGGMVKRVEGGTTMLYGAARNGGWRQSGTLFRLALGPGNPEVSTVFEMPGERYPSHPLAALFLGSDGDLYGTTAGGTEDEKGFQRASLFRYRPGVPPEFEVLHAFDFAASHPAAGLVAGPDGALYGTTSDAVYRVDEQGQTWVLRPLSSNDEQGGLTMANSGSLYGILHGGQFSAADNGSVFTISPSLTFSTVHSFGAGEPLRGPRGSLAQVDGAFYGLASAIAPFGDVLFKVSTSGDVSVAHRFAAGLEGVDSTSPTAGADGRLYGATRDTGLATASDPCCGTIYSVDPGVDGLIIHARLSEAVGYDVRGSLVQARDGALFGTASRGGEFGFGTVFRVDPSTNDIKVIHSFTGGADGAYPFAGLIEGADGALYGSTPEGGLTPDAEVGAGTVFRIARNGGLTTLHTFDARSWGEYAPYGALFEATPGEFYGTARDGGPTGRGAVFRLSVPPTPPSAVVAPLSIDFGPTEVNSGSGTHAVTVGNTGTWPLSVVAAVSGTNAGDFVVNGDSCQGVFLESGQTCSIDIGFEPKAAGPRTGVLQIAHDGSPEPVVVQLSGLGLAPAISVAPATLTFASHAVGTTSEPQTITLTNTGTGWLSIFAIAATGDFTHSTTCPANGVPPAGSCAISVRFAPTLQGARAGALTISSDASASPLALPLTGTGGNPPSLAVQVTSPNGGEMLVAGRPYTIRWTASGPVQTFSVRAMRADGSVMGISDCGAVDGAARECIWRAPRCPGICPAGMAFRIQVVAFGANGDWAADVSDDVFRLLGLVIDEPSIGAYWQIGTVAHITWRHNLGAGSNVLVELSRDGGSTYTLLDGPVANQSATSGSYDWPVNDTLTNLARVRVTWEGDLAVRDVSNWYFPIAVKPRPSLYRVTDLGAAGDVSSDVNGMSSNGQVVGNAVHGDGSITAFRWNGSRTALGTLGGCCSVAADISRSGQTVGWSRTPSGTYHAFMADSPAPALDLGTLGGAYSEAVAINDHNAVVGGSAVDASMSTTNWHAFLWDQGVMRDLGTLGGPGSFAMDINNDGVIVGRSRATAAGPERAFVYRDGVMRDITPSGWKESGATAVNDLGAIVGWRAALGGESTHQRAFLRSPQGGFKDLATLGGSGSMASDINNRGEVVGSVDGALAFLYAKGVMRDLNALIPPASGWALRSAQATNDRGQIVGTGEYGGAMRGFLLTPAVHLASLTISPRTIEACASATATLTLDARAPEDITVALSGSDALHVPATVVVPAGESTVTFAVSTVGADLIQTGTITARYGDDSRVASAKVTRIAIAAVSMAATARAGDAVTGTVSIGCVAPTAIQVSVSSSNPLIAAVETPLVTLAAGETEATFRVRGMSDGAATITAKAPGASLGTIVEVSGGPLPAVEYGPVVRNGHTYYLLHASSWQAAERSAQSLGGHLVTIDDAAENSWVFTTFASRGGALRMLWLGLTDTAREGRFSWTSGERTSYRQWDGGEPNDDPGNILGQEDVVHMYPPIDARGSRWNDVNGFPGGDLPFHGVVEVPRLP